MVKKNPKPDGHGWDRKKIDVISFNQYRSNYS